MASLSRAAAHYIQSWRAAAHLEDDDRRRDDNLAQGLHDRLRVVLTSHGLGHARSADGHDIRNAVPLRAARALRRPHLRGRAARPADGGAGAARPSSTLDRAPHHRLRGQPSLSPPAASPFFWQVLENRLRLPSSDLEGYWRNIAFLSIFVVFFRVLSTVMISRRLVK